MTDPNRPDPDALLRSVQRQEQRAQRGSLRVLFGFAPGVGKTYRMLQLAHAQRLSGVDVVAGIVETHGRAETAALLDELEVLPRCDVEYRGRVLSELDLERALERRPELLLVDELAHTNAPGSRHPKRWQDVQELLDAGINVITTLNVQHLESLNDVVAQITHVRVKETVPDSVIDAANEIELVDLAPDALLQRLQEGKVYVPHQAKLAATNFFKRSNLLALREIALRRTAQHVEGDFQAYREEHGVSAIWPAAEHILVAVGPAPSSAHLIRATARMAAGLHCTWVAAYVDTLASDGGAARARLEAHLRLVETLGGRVARLTGSRVAESLLAYSRKHNVTRLVIGKPTHPRVRDRLRGSLLDAIVRGSHDIDVHVIRGEVDAEDRARTRAQRPRPHAPALAYVRAAALVAATTGIGLAVRTFFAVPDLEVLYLLAVMLTAARWGRGPAIFTAALGVAAYDFAFVPPYYRLAVADARYFLTFGMLFGVGIVVSELTSRIRRQERDALAREERTASLYAFSRDLDRAYVDDHAADRTSVARVIATRAAEAFEARAFVFLAGEAGELATVATQPKNVAFEGKELAMVRWCFDRSKPAGHGTDTLAGSPYTATPLISGAHTLGVLALEVIDPEPMGAEARESLLAFARQSALALARVQFAAEAHAARMRAETEEMRSSLLSAVSHDLRTPLAAITGAATALRDDAGLPGDTRSELLISICEEAERLERLVANLLDMTRLESGAVTLKKDWVPLDEIVGSALTRLEKRLGERPIRIDLASDLPLLLVDPVLLEQLFINVFENAAKYTPSGSPIELSARTRHGEVIIEVTDAGPGLTPGSEEQVFEKFTRGAHAGVAGVGLGLPICRAIARAHGGSMTARRREGAQSGTILAVILPIYEAPSVASEPEPGP